MKQILTVCIFLYSFFISVPSLKATEIDVNTLLQQLERAIEDTNKVNTLLGLTSYYMATSTKDNVKSLDYAKKAESLSLKLDFKKGKYFSYKYLAKIYKSKGIQYIIQQTQYEQKIAAAEKEYLKQQNIEKEIRIKNLEEESRRTKEEVNNANATAEENARIAALQGKELENKDKKIHEINAESLKKTLALLKSDSLNIVKDTLLYLKTLESLRDANELTMAYKDQEIKKKDLENEKAKNAFSYVLAASGGVLALLMIVMFILSRRNARKLTVEKKRSDDLLLNILPSEVADELKMFGKAKAKQFEMVTVMFTDFKGFTQISEKMKPEDLVDEIDLCFAEFDKIVSKHNIEKIKTIGDSYLCVGGLPVANTDNPINVVQAAIEIRDFMLNLKKEREKKGEICFEIRIGINTGPVVAGIVGIKKFAYDIWGDTVNTASRMESSGEVGKINISGSTYEFVKQDFLCQYRGKIDAKNKGQIDMYFAESLKKS